MEIFSFDFLKRPVVPDLAEWLKKQVHTILKKKWAEEINFTPATMESGTKEPTLVPVYKVKLTFSPPNTGRFKYVQYSKCLLIFQNSIICMYFSLCCNFSWLVMNSKLSLGWLQSLHLPLKNIELNIVKLAVQCTTKVDM